MFCHLTEACANFDVTLNITYLHLDFEIAVHETAVARWPNVIIKACQFHLSQAWWRKIQNLGLSTEYKKDDSEIAAWLKCFFGLSFLEPAEVEESFAYDFIPDMPENEKAMAFADYVVNTYIDPSAKFPPAVWADPDISARRTTNGCESFHSQFAELFYHPHPHIFDFMAKLNHVQTKSYLKIRASTYNAPATKRERERIEKLTKSKPSTVGENTQERNLFDRWHLRHSLL